MSQSDNRLHLRREMQLLHFRAFAGKCRAGVRGGQSALCNLLSSADKRGVCDKP
mgnify:FL=1